MHTLSLSCILRETRSLKIQVEEKAVRDAEMLKQIEEKRAMVRPQLARINKMSVVYYAVREDSARPHPCGGCL